MWLWISATSLVTVFRVLTTRGAAGAKALLGEDCWGVVGTDRYAAYNWIDPRRRQLCWAHLKREFLAWSEREGEAARLGQALLAVEKQLFQLCERLLPVQTAFRDLFKQAQASRHWKVAGPAGQLLKHWETLWTFTRREGVEPTNNCAERPLRRAVLWRRRSFGTQSEAGSQFVERILTAVTTLRQQRRDVLAYLTAACAAAVRHEPAPSLLPLTQPTPFAR